MNRLSCQRSHHRNFLFIKWLTNKVNFALIWFRDGPGFIKNNRIDPAKFFYDFCILKIHAMLTQDAHSTDQK